LPRLDTITTANELFFRAVQHQPETIVWTRREEPRVEMNLNQTVADHFGKVLIPSTVFGVEVEVEAATPSPERDTVLWAATADNSLRGYSKEYILNTPSPLAETINAVEVLYRRFAKNNVVLHDSMRAGVHIHINQTHKTLKQVVTFLCAYWLVEDYLIETYCGTERSGNLFCLRLKDAEAPLSQLYRRLWTKTYPLVTTMEADLFRYGSVNIGALSKLGTLEFRALRTPTTSRPLVAWLTVLDHLHTAAETYASPADLIDALSGEGPTRLVNQLLGSDLEEGQNDYRFLESARRVQLLAYGIDWNQNE
jgi:hypothetical protein